MASGFGKYIVIEGGDYCGKQVQMDLLEISLRELGYDALRVREPGGTEVGEKIREIVIAPEFKGKILPFTDVMLFNAARHQLCEEVIRPALKAGKTVLSDRSYLSTIVYQGYQCGMDIKMVEQICHEAMAGCEPDKIFVLDISPEELGRRRKKASRAEDRFDGNDLIFHNTIRQGYLSEAKNSIRNNIEIINGEKSAESVAKDILRKTLRILR